MERTPTNESVLGKKFMNAHAHKLEIHKSYHVLQDAGPQLLAITQDPKKIIGDFKLFFTEA